MKVYLLEYVEDGEAIIQIAAASMETAKRIAIKQLGGVRERQQETIHEWEVNLRDKIQADECRAQLAKWPSELQWDDDDGKDTRHSIATVEPGHRYFLISRLEVQP